MTATWTATLWYDDIAPDDHPETGLARLIWQYRGSQPRIQAFLRILLDQLQSIEDVSMDVLAGIWPLTAIGEQLDTLGVIVGQGRGTLTDDEYRIIILGRIFVNLMDGTLEEFLKLLEIVGVTEQIYADEAYPCFFRLDATGMTHGEIIGSLVLDGAPAGVDLLWIYSNLPETDTFAMSNVAGADQASVLGGFADLLGAVGGRMSGAAK